MRVDKIKIWRKLTKELKGTVQLYHIFAVMSILVDEIKKYLLDGNDIKIKNFGTFKLRKTNERQFKSVQTNKYEISKPKNKLELKLSHKLGKFIANKIDEDLTNE